MIDPGIRFGKRFVPTTHKNTNVINLSLPTDDKDKIESNLAQDRREAYEEHARDEVPKLRNINAVLASDYFRYGWEAAIAKYSREQINSNKKFEFTPTTIQTATVMALTGNDKQKEEAREFFTQFLNRI